MKNRQHRTMILERKETHKVSSTITLVFFLKAYSFCGRKAKPR